MKYYFALLILTGIVGFVIPQIYACECESLTLDDHLMNADVVFQGTIIREPAIIEKNLVASFSAIDVFKRPSPEFDYLFNRGKVNVTTGIDSGICGVDFQMENTYIVFGTIYEDKIHTTSCSGTTKIDNYLEQMLRLQHYDSSPYEQFKSGIPIDQIQCKGGFVVAIKASNNSPACVKQGTLQKLRERGWAEPLGNIVFEKPSELNHDKTIPRPRYQMKMGIPLEEIKCKEGFYPTFKIDRVTPACVTEKTLDELMLRGWAPLRMGMPAETNILITYGAIQVYPHNVTKKLDPRSPYFNDVFWVNNDIVPHTVISEDGTWSTRVIESGKMGSVSFNKTGIYKYFIKEKPSTTGFVEFSGIVEPDD